MRRLHGGPMFTMVLLAIASGVASADVFILEHGGRVEGELLNEDELLRKTFHIRTPSGSEITLARSQVAKWLRPRPEKTEYDRIRPRFADTVEEQWKLAEWCRERVLLAERTTHLERILELDPNHEQARRALGYSQRRGGWTTEEREREAMGFVKFRNGWRLPQEVELIEEQERIKRAEGQWQQKLDLWRGWLNGERSQLAYQNLVGIDDPFAVKPLAKALKDEPDEQVRLLYVEALANVGTSQATKMLSVWAVEDGIEEVRLTCLDHLKEHETGSVEAVEYFVGMLRSKKNNEINLAAAALEHMEDPSAIGPLIDVLVTTHEVTLPGRNPGQMSTTFGGGGGSPGGLSIGGGPKKVLVTRQNRAVLEALVHLTGGPNFHFDVRAWKAWHASQRQFLGVDARRD